MVALLFHIDEHAFFLKPLKINYRRVSTNEVRIKEIAILQGREEKRRILWFLFMAKINSNLDEDQR